MASIILMSFCGAGELDARPHQEFIEFLGQFVPLLRAGRVGQSAK